jgi:hypothetical protein
MLAPKMPPDRVDAYLAALEARHLANLTRSELTRALRALSSCYVERRGRLAGGGALEGAGKRAAFALFYGPLHFLTIDAIVHGLGADEWPIETIHDLGCGTGASGAAWALAAARPPVIAGVDRSAWAAAEANWTYRQLGLRGSAKVGDVSGFPYVQASRSRGSAFLLAYAVNELAETPRARLLDALAAALATQQAALLIVEPIAKKDRSWWPEWAARLAPAGAVEREWRFRADLPPLLREVAKGAGLDPRELTARTLSRP